MAEDEKTFAGDGAPRIGSTSTGASVRSLKAALEASCRKRKRGKKKQLGSSIKKGSDLSKAVQEPSELIASSMPMQSCWDPKHTIFLSHSGAQKEFTRFLFEALKNAHYSPFMDEDAGSLTKSEKWFGTLMDATKQCRVAILVLSDEFLTRSKWPTMELNEFAKTPMSMSVEKCRHPS